LQSLVLLSYLTTRPDLKGIETKYSKILLLQYHYLTTRPDLKGIETETSDKKIVDVLRYNGRMRSEKVEAEKDLKTVGSAKRRVTKGKNGVELEVAKAENELLDLAKNEEVEGCIVISLKDKKSLGFIEKGTKDECEDKKLEKLMRWDEKYIHIHSHTNHSPHSIADLYRFLKDDRIAQMRVVVGDRTYVVEKTKETFSTDMFYEDFKEKFDSLYKKMFPKDKNKTAVKMYKRNKEIAKIFKFVIREELYYE